MLYLPEPSKETVDAYYFSIKDRVENALKKAILTRAARNFLSSQTISEIIISKPDKLLYFHNNLIPLLARGFTPNDYNNYLVTKEKPKKLRSKAEQNLISRYDPKINEIRHIFDYNRFISSHKITSYNLAKALDRNTCTYCNRLYTITIEEKNKKTNRFNDDGRITRPQFDHWFSKNKYPILALSFFNLIPSCSVCNSSLKGDTEFKLRIHNHPYINKKQNDFTFSFRLRTVHESNVIINVAQGSKTERTLNEFKILEIYNGHSNLELRDLLDLKFKYSEDYLSTLFNETFKGALVNEKEAFRLIFGVECEEENFHKRPFNKFKKDIISELRKIDRSLK
jgi:hypothetical protein